MKKSDVEHHVLGYGGRAYPAVNVKIRKSIDSVELPLCTGGTADPIRNQAGEIIGHTPLVWHYTEPGFTHDWIEAHVSDQEMYETWLGMAAEDGWEQLREVATEVFGSRARVWSEGRSGGWAVVEGLPDFDSWDAIELSKWRRFAKVARQITDGVLETAVMNLYINVYEPLVIERDRALGDLDVPDWHVATQASRTLAAAQEELA